MSHLRPAVCRVVVSHAPSRSPPPRDNLPFNLALTDLGNLFSSLLICFECDLSHVSVAVSVKRRVSVCQEDFVGWPLPLLGLSLHKYSLATTRPELTPIAYIIIAFLSFLWYLAGQLPLGSFVALRLFQTFFPRRFFARLLHLSDCSKRARWR
jgi:hypothetical protein